MKPKYEGSPEDKKKDKKAAKLFGMPLKKYEHSAIDKAADAYGQHKLDVEQSRKKRLKHHGS